MTDRAGHLLLYWLGKTARTVRLDSRAKMREISALAHLDKSSLYRFEAGRTWPEHVERVIAAYADAAGIDARKVWLTAVELWLRYGAEPVLSRQGHLVQGDAEVPAAALRAMEAAIGAYARGIETEELHNGRGSSAVPPVASSTRARP